MPNILVILIACSALLSLIFFIATVAALRKKKLFSSAFHFLLALLVLSSAVRKSKMGRKPFYSDRFYRNDRGYLFMCEIKITLCCYDDHPQ